MALRIFVSYSRDDNDVPRGLEKARGFVTTLQDELEYEFRNLGPIRPTIWRDVDGIEKGAQFKDVIEAAINDSDIFLVVLSENWLSRAWCLDELAMFEKRWRHEGEAKLRTRIVVVSKHPLEYERRPASIQGQQVFEFYALERGDRPENASLFFDRGIQPGFHQRLKELARYLLSFAPREDAPRSAAPAAPPEPAPVKDMGRAVFVAKPATDMRAAYARVVEELKGRGFRVLPDAAEEIPSDDSATAYVDAALAEAEFSVHLLGEKPGPAPEDTAPIAMLQLARGREATGKDGDLPRLIWAPKVLSDTGEAERDPLAVLARFDRHDDADSILGENLSKFVEFLLQYLDRTAPMPTLSEHMALLDPESLVYINCNPVDYEYAQVLATELMQRRIEATLPALEGDDAERLATHRRDLQDCNAVVLCWAAATDVWVKPAKRELRNWRDLGRSDPFSCRVLIAGPPPGRTKGSTNLMPSSEIDLVIDLTAHAEPSPTALDPLVGAARVAVP